MSRQKIDYGIDLGTTNSAIARMDNGNIAVKKSDQKQKDTTPSCIFFNKKQMLFVGDRARNSCEEEAIKALKDADLRSNGFMEFKRGMGSDGKYDSSNMNRSYTPEELSAEVLKKLKSYVRDEEVNAIVITVPAKFDQAAIDATQRAAELAGFQHCELLPEPIAASLGYGIDARRANGYWFVFDFGGGTFDAALMQVVDGIMKVQDTEGDRHLGGKDIDYAIVDEIVMPQIPNVDPAERARLREVLKWLTEEAKIAISPEGKDKVTIAPDEPYQLSGGREIDFTIEMRLQDFERVAGPIFQKAIDISKDLLKRNNLTGNDLETIILVGGPTYSQVLRKMAREQLSPKVNTSVDPMTVVAKGAALFASTKDIPMGLQKRSKTKIQLTLKYPETTVEMEVLLGIRVERNQTIGDVPQRVFAEIYRAEGGWSSGRFEIKADAELTTLHL